jgi:hypothetical protein
MPRNTYTGPLPTIGYTRAQGVGRIRVYCIQGCGHSGMVEIDRLGMPDELAFVHIPAQRRQVCTGCGGRRGLVGVPSNGASSDATRGATGMTIIDLLDLRAVHVLRLANAWFRRQRLDQGQSFRGHRSCDCSHSNAK